MVWLQLALVVALLGVLAVTIRRLHRVSPDFYTDIDVGTVSERWLAEHRGSRRTDYRLVHRRGGAPERRLQLLAMWA
jgi:hypothetical protein